MDDFDDSNDFEGLANLDHALLESLFYNEVAMMDDNSSILPSNLFDSVKSAWQSEDGIDAVVENSDVTDPKVFAEKALLRDFGVSPATLTMEMRYNDNNPVQDQQYQTEATSHATMISQFPPVPIALSPAQILALHQQNRKGGIRHNVTTTISTSPALVASSGFTAPNNPLSIEPGNTIRVIQNNATIDLHQYTGNSSAFMKPENQHSEVCAVSKSISSAPSTTILSSIHSGAIQTPTVLATTAESSSATVPASSDDEKKRTKLLSQFATLASRLGISLPPQVLKQITDTPPTTDCLQLKSEASAPSCASDDVATNNPGAQPSELVQSSSVQSSVKSTMTDNAPSVLTELQNTAAESIAAVTRKRSFSDDEDGKKNGISSNRSYCKRRKKPRLSECEIKLANLRSENEMLKRHLDNISNRTAKLEQERIAVEVKMRRMFEEGAPDEEIDAVIKNYAEMYSDYGKKRDQELNFHLEQLQRLANPTNFTKMGLWTLGQQSKDTKNPIAGILQKELGITAQQGRKILEQRQKIQSVCANLKECLVLLGTLKALCEQKTKIFHDRMEKCREILTPKQVVKLLIWVNENSSVLGSVCPGWGSEQFQSKPTK